MTHELPAVYAGDLDSEAARAFELAGKQFGLAVDTETTGLNFANDSVEVVSIAVPGTVAVVTIDRDRRPSRLASLLENGAIQKIFHNALFDMTFLSRQWDYRVNPIFCTKVAARLGDISRNPTLASLVDELLGVHLDKRERRSDWTSRPLTAAQVSYAGSDVRYLHDLQRRLTWRLADRGRTELFDACMTFLTARADLTLLGLGDVFAYELAPQFVATRGRRM